MPRSRPKTTSVAKKITQSAKDVHAKIIKSKSPTMTTPVRSLSNVKYHSRTGYFEMLGKNKQRTLTVSTVKTFAQTLKMMALSKELIDTNDMATKREAYYISKNWGKAGFAEQSESDTIMDDVEAMFGVNREQLKFTPEEKGGDVTGKLIVIDSDSKGRKIKIDCTKFGSGAYSIPTEVENLQFQGRAKFILAIETAGMFQRLVKYNYYSKTQCILVSMGGVPTRACRRFIRRLSEQLKSPVYAFVDGDPYGYFNIYRTLKVGSGNAAHMNRFFCVPSVHFLGVTPQDIVTYKLPTHPLKDVDIKRAKDALRNDPFVKHHKPWQKAINQMLKMGVRVEQQAFAKHGLDFVVNEYLPAKLRNPSKFLP
ncbi:MAG: DNA topoisomerase IV subunit A [Sedimentisphaerales bacterium]|nr:DNA topoisomerase IV subunit A [Sedimentisphaerales bacterium]